MDIDRIASLVSSVVEGVNGGVDVQALEEIVGVLIGFAQKPDIGQDINMLFLLIFQIVSIGFHDQNIFEITLPLWKVYIPLLKTHGFELADDIASDFYNLLDNFNQDGLNDLTEEADSSAEDIAAASGSMKMLLSFLMRQCAMVLHTHYFNSHAQEVATWFKIFSFYGIVCTHGVLALREPCEQSLGKVFAREGRLDLLRQLLASSCHSPPCSKYAMVGIVEFCLEFVCKGDSSSVDTVCAVHLVVFALGGLSEWLGDEQVEDLLLRLTQSLGLPLSLRLPLFWLTMDSLALLAISPSISAKASVLARSLLCCSLTILPADLQREYNTNIIQSLLGSGGMRAGESMRCAELVNSIIAMGSKDSVKPLFDYIFQLVLKENTHYNQEILEKLLLSLPPEILVQYLDAPVVETIRTQLDYSLSNLTAEGSYANTTLLLLIIVNLLSSEEREKYPVHIQHLLHSYCENKSHGMTLLRSLHPLITQTELLLTNSQLKQSVYHVRTLCRLFYGLRHIVAMLSRHPLPLPVLLLLSKLAYLSSSLFENTYNVHSKELERSQRNAAELLIYVLEVLGRFECNQEIAEVVRGSLRKAIAGFTNGQQTSVISVLLVKIRLLSARMNSLHPWASTVCTEVEAQMSKILTTLPNERDRATESEETLIDYLSDLPSISAIYEALYNTQSW